MLNNDFIDISFLIKVVISNTEIAFEIQWFVITIYFKNILNSDYRIRYNE